MAQREVKFEDGGFYHIYNRGAGKQEIIRAADNYQFLINKIRLRAKQTNIAVISFCLMPNHYHLLVRQDSYISAGLFVQLLFNSYSKAFNNMYGRSGTLFEAPFKAIQVDKTEYLTHLCRYIHRNPIEAGLVNHINGWKYSNYLDCIGKWNK